MNREEALKDWLPIIRQKVKGTEVYEEALEMAIEALEQEPCDDCISREKALKALMDEWTEYDSELMDYLIEKVRKLPSVTAQPNKWIPVETALPEDHKDVLIYLSSDQICIGCYNSHRLPFSNNVIGWGANYAHNWCSKDVVAWMQLPTPPNKSEIPTSQIVANGELYPGEFDDPLAEEGSDKE